MGQADKSCSCIIEVAGWNFNVPLGSVMSIAHEKRLQFFIHERKMTMSSGFYKLYTDVNGFWRWRYVASNGKTIADSGEGYFNKADCLRGVEIMKGSAGSPTY